MFYVKALFPTSLFKPTNSAIRKTTRRLDAVTSHIDLLLQSLTPHTLLFRFVHRFYLIPSDTITQRKDESRLAIDVFVGIIGLRGKRDTNV